MIKVFTLICTVLSILSFLLIKADLNVIILAVFSGGIFVQELTIDKLLQRIKELEDEKTRNVN